MQQMNCINQREAKKRGVIDRIGYAQGYNQGLRDGKNKRYWITSDGNIHNLDEDIDKAIDEFVNKLEYELTNAVGTDIEQMTFAIMVAKNIAGQMKGQENARADVDI